MAVKVIDAIMGTGKSTAATNYINEQCASRKILYVTEYLPEAKRIALACPQAHMEEPTEKKSVAGRTKTQHFRELVTAGANVSCSHALFRWCPQDILDGLREQNYIVIIDEVMDIFEDADVTMGGIDFMVAAEALIRTELDESGDIVRYDLNPGKNFQVKELLPLFNKLGRQPILQIKEIEERKNAKAKLYSKQWMLPKELFEVSDDIFILTYLFDGSPLRSFLQINEIPVEHWCVTKRDGRLTFGSNDPYIPEYVHDIKNKLHICRNEKRNAIGDKYEALSVNWFKRERKPAKKAKLEELRTNIRWFMRDCKEVPKHKASERMWTCFKQGSKHIVDDGYTRADVPFNKRATNEFRNRKVLAYCANVFAKPGLKKFCELYGVTYNEDEFALSTLVQWIWRSAIRDGEEVWLYVPSSRMRNLLDAWLDEVSSGVVTGYQKHLN